MDIYQIIEIYKNYIVNRNIRGMNQVNRLEEDDF